MVPLSLFSENPMEQVEATTHSKTDDMGEQATIAAAA